MNLDSFLHIIHSGSDFTIILFHTTFYVIVGLGLYNLLKIIFYGRKLWEDFLISASRSWERFYR